jgi:hypothetical protein
MKEDGMSGYLQRQAEIAEDRAEFGLCTECGSPDHASQTSIIKDQAEQIQALTAELDAVRGDKVHIIAEAESQRIRANRAEDERDAMAAQVAALVACIQCDGGQHCYGRCASCQALANIPAAAAAYLAAMRVAQACQAFRDGDAPRTLARAEERRRLADAIDAALADWRKAAGRE